MNNRVKLLTTGGSGYLGSTLCLQAVAKNYLVWATCLKNIPPEIDGINPERLDLRDKRATSELIEKIKPEVVIHTAYVKNDKSVIYDATCILAEACRNLQYPPFFIFISTDFVFDGKKGFYNEEDETNPFQEYERQKLAAEKKLFNILPNVLVVRTSLMYDLKREPDNLQFIFDTWAKGKKCYIFNHEFLSPILVEDLSRALIRLAELKRGGLLHVAGTDAVDRYWFGTRLLLHFGYSIENIGAGSLKKSGLDRPSNCSLDSSKAEKIVGFTFRGAKDVLKNVV